MFFGYCLKDKLQVANNFSERYVKLKRYSAVTINTSIYYACIFLLSCDVAQSLLNIMLCCCHD